MKRFSVKNALNHTILLNILVWVVYFTTGYLGLYLAVPPGYATAIWPPSGIAIGAVVLWGYRVLPGIFLGSFCVNLYITSLQSSNILSSTNYLVGADIGLGAVIQAVVGIYLIKKTIGIHSLLENSKDILISSFLLTPIIGFINAFWSSSTLWYTGIVAHEDVLSTITTWWAGDSIGILIFTPIVLILFSRPRAIWSERILPILFPLAIGFTAVLIIYILIVNIEVSRLENKFANLTKEILNQVHLNLMNDYQVSQSLGYRIASNPKITKKTFRNISEKILQSHKEISVAAWLPKVKSQKDHGNYFASLFIYPLQPKHLLVDQSFWHAINQKALEISKNSIDDYLLTLPSEYKQSHQGVILLKPQYKQQELTGFVLLIIDIERLIKPMYPQFQNFYLLKIDEYSDKKNKKTTPIYQYQSHNNQVAGNKFHINTVQNIKVGTRTLQVKATASNYFINKNFSWLVWATLISGFIFCSFLNILLFIITGQKKLIQREVTEKTAKLNIEEEKNFLLLNSAGEGIYGLNEKGEVTFINRAAEKMLGYSEHELLGANMHQAIHAKYCDGSIYPEADCPIFATFRDGKAYHINKDILWRKDGTFFWVAYTSSPIEMKDKKIGAVVIFNDISHQLEAERQLKQLAFYDPLTHLPNRKNFYNYLERRVSQGQRDQKHFALCIFDIDNFKQINDALGHAVGDKLLDKIPNLLKPALRKSDFIARLGGDEFAIVLENIHRPSDTKPLIKRYLGAFDNTIIIDNFELKISISVGIALYEGRGTTANEIVKNADIAMYKAKESGKNTYAFYCKELQRQVLKKHKIHYWLRRAIKDGELFLNYQPIISRDNSQVVGVEALARWNSKILGSVSPTEFIQLAEENGLIHEIGTWVFETACKDIKEILANIKNQTFYVTINVSSKQLENEAFSKKIEETLNKNLIKKNQIVLEVTETSLISKPNTVANSMNRLQKSGVLFALDDYGTGYCSLDYLKKFPISFLKIDLSLTKYINIAPYDDAIIKAIIQLANELGIKTVAEGVETQAQVDFLTAKGCNLFQGFWYSKPLSLPAVISFINKYHSN